MSRNAKAWKTSSLKYTHDVRIADFFQTWFSGDSDNCLIPSHLRDGEKKNTKITYLPLALRKTKKKHLEETAVTLRRLEQTHLT